MATVRVLVTLISPRVLKDLLQVMRHFGRRTATGVLSTTNLFNPRVTLFGVSLICLTKGKESERGKWKRRIFVGRE